MGVVLADAGSTPAISTNYLKTHCNTTCYMNKKGLNFNSLGFFYVCYLLCLHTYSKLIFVYLFVYLTV